jgi:peptidyl-prolyl cis-trans isomerase SurA
MGFPGKISPFLALAVLLGVAVSSATGDEQLVDRLVAVVDDDPILESQLEQTIGIGLLEQQEGEDDSYYRRRVLDGLIEEKLRFHEVDRFGFAEVPVDEVEKQFEAVRDRFPDEQSFQARLQELNLDEQGLRQLLARQVMVMIYVEERLGARIFVGLEEIQAYYDEVLVPRLERNGEPIPQIREVREPIRQVLKQELLNEEIERWTDELRRQADIVDYFDQPPRELPPVVHRVGD